ncbi:ferrochelatase [Cricetibacter osteomyelitidis]|uniref:Ferrochelatase n=1 Tax=Cricetibacter osteomyelitidis TaxID=1521931 RepID=A0A4R2T5I5_9PAST|nr:ferrochelatase [Cricetibacter osteomyelitidis]TCP97680.1 ferrochelatase [Cricetibacter osteomyelitidis]
MKKIGIILANLGTPDDPTPRAVSRYLKEFLSDRRIVDLPRLKWLFLLNAIILPRRSKRVAKKYQTVWTEQGSPLLVFSQKQQQKLQSALGSDYIVEIGMSYGNPTIQSAMDKLIAQKVEKIIVLPLYPQYSSTTTMPVFDAFAKSLTTHRHIVPFEFIHSYQQHPLYIKALADSIKVRLKSDEFLLFSYHGIPLRYENNGDYYREHCKQTTIAVVNQLGLTENQWAMSFQSHFGKEEWLQPYTNKAIENYPSEGIQKLAVICPGFSADCLETLEEIEQENREYFMAAGGTSYQYIPALNDDEAHIALMKALIVDKK